MAANDFMSAKKRELLAYKAKILQEMKYYDKRIEEVRSKCLKTSFVDDSDSSESDEEFSLTIDNGPSISELKLHQTMLRTRLQATQELTSVQVLQSEVNVLVDDPEIIGEPQVKESGVWREVTAECRVDLVPFSITFFVHQPDRQFGQVSYRGLRAVPVKAAHAGELGASVLSCVATPGDAVEVLKSYASAQRSRRTTLARLADKYPSQLYMEPLPDGGYILKCANLLEVSWTLQNKWSPIAPFHHRMKFDLEYMDESYIKIITQAHRQLSDPSLETDERTLLLSKIISTCLEAQGPTQELYESMSSDPENSQTLKTRRTTLDQEPDGPGMKKKKKKELMAPPKSLPRKSKLKGKENVDDNRKEKVKRSNSNENMNTVKKMRTDDKIVSENDPKDNGVSDKAKSVANVEISANKQVKAKEVDSVSVASTKNIEAKKLNKKDNKAVNDIDKTGSKDIAIEKNKISKEKNKKDVKKSNDINDAGNTAVEKNKTVKEKSDKTKEGTQSKNLEKGTSNDKNVNKPKTNKEKAMAIDKNSKSDYAKQKDVEDKNPNKEVTNNYKTNNIPKPSKEKVTKATELNKNEQNNIKNDDNKKTTATVKKTPKVTKSAKNIHENDEKASTGMIEKVKSVAALKNKPDSAKTTNSTSKRVKEKVTAEKYDAETVTKSYKGTNKIIQAGNKNIVNTKTKPSTNIKVPSKSNTDVNKLKTVTDKTKPNENKKESNHDKPQTKQITKTKSPMDKNKPIQNTNKLTANSKIPLTEKTIDKVVERQSVAIKRKSNMADRIDDDASAKKVSKLPNAGISAEKIKNVADNKMQKTAKVLTSKNDQKLKSKLLPGGIKTHMGNNKFLSNIEKQNSDKKSKIPQKKLPAISETTLKKNPLRISPRKIPSKFKTTDSNKQKVIQKTTSIPRLLKKPVPKT